VAIDKERASAAGESAAAHIAARARNNRVRAGADPESIACAIVDSLFYRQGRLPEFATPTEWYNAVARTIRDHVVDHFVETARILTVRDSKIVCYLSAEFLVGPQLMQNLINLQMLEKFRGAIALLGLDFEEIVAQEEEPGLGNGGLGRLAACFLESMSTLEIPAIGYGLRYEFGIFDQEIRDGWQREVTDKWLRLGNPWEVAVPEISYPVMFGGRTETYHDAEGRYRVRWIPSRVVNGTPFDIAGIGYHSKTTNLLRLWKAEATESFDFAAFNEGDYYRAVEKKVESENLTKILYPNDSISQGKQLRLEQQYFFVSCSLQDMLRLHLRVRDPLDAFHTHFAAQLNDTHPALAIPELMRLLVDEYLLDWEAAWHVTTHTFGYTNHTLLSEALERWALPLFASVLPRHLEIIFEINRRFLDEVRVRYPHDGDRAARMSLIDEHGEKAVRMAHLATVGSHAVNGVAVLHSQLLKHGVLRDFHDLYPERFHNVTNGVTPRRFMAECNPGLARLITEAIGDAWIRDAEQELPKLEPFADAAEFRKKWRAVKRANKVRLAGEIGTRAGVVVDPDSLFDIQVKRIHEYKRQHLNILHVVTRYLRLLEQRTDAPPRTVVFAGKAAPAYAAAKLIIKLINAVGGVANGDERIGGRLRVAFLPDFNVTNAQRIYPAGDLSEQISLAGTEASGTGNMKFAMNGALTIGTLDGANIEIREAVGAENFFAFGLTTEQVRATKAAGYSPRSLYERHPRLREILDLLSSGRFSRGDAGLFQPIVDAIINRDEYLLLADYDAYVAAQDRVDAAFADAENWTRSSILTVARMGRFSSDRAIREYCRDIWQVEPILD
jgi:starch phosphorylase